MQDLLWHLTSAYMKSMYGWAGVRYVITKFSRMDSLPNFLTHGAPLRARFARARGCAIRIWTNRKWNYSLVSRVYFDRLLISWVTNNPHNHFYMIYSIDRELHSLKRLQLKFWLKFIIFRVFFNNLIESFLMCSFVSSGFLRRPLMLWHPHS